MREISLLALGLCGALAGCRSEGVPGAGAEPASSDFRSAPLTITSLGCAPEEASSTNAYELAWRPADRRFTVDLYSADGAGCAQVRGAATIDHVADILFLHFDAERCDTSCGQNASHVRLELDDDLHELTNMAGLVVSSGATHPDLANVIVTGEQFFVRADYAQTIAMIDEATFTTSGTASVLTVHRATPACSGTLRTIVNPTTTLVPYALTESDPLACAASVEGLYFVDHAPTPTGPLRVLSKKSDGSFAFVATTN